ncbi:MAG: c-type cytochrome [Candidatus Methylomirabilales bacterium]
MKLRFVIAALVLTWGVGGGTPPAFAGHEAFPSLLPGNPLEGSRLFLEKGCIRCHAVYGVGGTTGPDLGRRILTRPLLEIAGVMWNHLPGMERAFRKERVLHPAFEVREMASILAFLYYLGSLDPPGDAAVGARLFREKGCQICHSLGGHGGAVGPALDKYSRYASPIYLTAALWKRGKAMAKTMRAKGVPRPTFHGNDIPNLLAYIRSVGGGTERVYARPGSPKRGEALFTKKSCVRCHAIRGHGGKVGPDLGLALKGSLMRIVGAMWNHGPKMWTTMEERGITIPSLSPEELSDLISYLYFAQFIDVPGDAKRGEAVYREKGCGICHGFTGTGKRVAPPLTQVVKKRRTPLEIITKMWNHAGKMEAKMMEASVAWPFFRRGEMEDLIAYLTSVSRDGRQPPAPAAQRAR